MQSRAKNFVGGLADIKTAFIRSTKRVYHKTDYYKNFIKFEMVKLKVYGAFCNANDASYLHASTPHVQSDCQMADLKQRGLQYLDTIQRQRFHLINRSENPLGNFNFAFHSAIC